MMQQSSLSLNCDMFLGKISALSALLLDRSSHVSSREYSKLELFLKTLQLAGPLYLRIRIFVEFTICYVTRNASSSWNFRLEDKLEDSITLFISYLICILCF